MSKGQKGDYPSKPEIVRVQPLLQGKLEEQPAFVGGEVLLLAGAS